MEKINIGCLWLVEWGYYIQNRGKDKTRRLKMNVLDSKIWPRGKDKHRLLKIC